MCTIQEKAQMHSVVFMFHQNLPFICKCHEGFFIIIIFSGFFSLSRYNNRGIIHCNFDCLSHCRCGHFVSKSNHGVITITRLVAKQHPLCLPSHHDWYSYFQLKMELKALLFNEYLIMQGVTFL